jgi:F plasmid transfer operon, TraF, protein
MLNRLRGILGLALGFLIIATSVSAEEWRILGPRAFGMGGAFVAVAKGPIAQHWNPAGLAQDENASGLEIPVGVRAEITSTVLEGANQVGELANKYTNITDKQTNGGTLQADELSAMIEALSGLKKMDKPGEGGLVNIAGGVALKLSKLSLSITNFTAIGVTPNMDFQNIGLGSATGITGINIDGTGTPATDTAAVTSMTDSINQIGADNMYNLICGSDATTGCNGITGAAGLANALVYQAEQAGADPSAAAAQMAAYAGDAASIIAALSSGDGNPYENNQTALVLRSGMYTEVALGYAMYVPFFPGLAVGGNAKLIDGKMGYARFEPLKEDANSFDSFEDYNDNTKTTIKPAFDLGGLLELNKLVPLLPWNPRIGLVAKNINAPTFEQPDLAKTYGEGDNRLDAQIRLGAAINPTHFWTIAMDVDVTNNDTPLEGYKSRQLALGTEINVINKPAFNIPLRAGIRKNLAQDSSKYTLTAGTGLNLVHLHIDVAGAISPSTVNVDGSDIPSNFGAAISVGLLF